MSKQEVIFDPKRGKGESFQDYKKRMAAITIVLRMYKKGIPMWVSRDEKDIGITYRR